VTWVGLSYLLVLVATVTAVGRFADMWGRKLLYVYGFVLFTLASVLCGLSPDLGALCGFRALQAVGAAMLQANSLAIIVLVVPTRALGRAIGLQGAAQALGLALGPSVGGLLLAVGGWRLIFFVNVPFGIFGAAAAILLVPRSRNLLARARFDWSGLAIFFPAVAALLCAITFGAAEGWSSPLIVGLFVVAVVLGGVFVWHERRDRDPMLDLALFRSGQFSTGIVSGFGSYLVMFGVLLLVPFFLERGQGFGTARSGLELMAMPLAFGIVAPFAGRLADHVGARPLTVSGMALVAVGLAVMAGVRPDTPGFLALLAALGVGMGLFTSPNNASIMGAAPDQQAGMASGVLNMTRGTGTALGLAVTGSVFVAAGGDSGGSASAQHAFSVTAYVLAGIAAAAGIVSALRANGTLADATLSSVE
jgi:EmrB/QacA subfamily drug resistance transporter